MWISNPQNVWMRVLPANLPLGLQTSDFTGVIAHNSFQYICDIFLSNSCLKHYLLWIYKTWTKVIRIYHDYEYMYKMYTAIHPKGPEIVVDISGMREWTGWVCHPYSHNVCVAKKGMQHCVYSRGHTVWFSTSSLDQKRDLPVHIRH